MYIYLTSRSESERSIIEAECEALTGSIPDKNGIAIREDDTQEDDGPNSLDIARSAYLKVCVKGILQASSFSELYERLEAMRIQAEQFRVSIEKTTKSIHVDSHGIMTEVGARIMVIQIFPIQS